MTGRDDLVAGHKLLGQLATVNTGLGRAVQRLLAHEQEHGRLPANQLRELGELLCELGINAVELADRLNRTIIDSDQPLARPRASVAAQVPSLPASRGAAIRESNWTAKRSHERD